MSDALTARERAVEEARSEVERHRGILRITEPYATQNQIDTFAEAYESLIAAAEALGAARERVRVRTRLTKLARYEPDESPEGRSVMVATEHGWMLDEGDVFAAIDGETP